MDQKDVVIAMDGRVLHGSTWIRPSDYQAAEIECGELGSMKGATPSVLPSLEQTEAIEMTPPTPGRGVGNLSSAEVDRQLTVPRSDTENCFEKLGR